ncbi:MAG: hypothetical protein AB7J13_11340 [Pyrinomonadaceae bacterium]
MTYIEELQDVIEKLHHGHAKHIETVPVKEVFGGETVWEGEVEVFDLVDNPDASRIYAWAYDYEATDKPTQHVTVLQIPPATTPENAVRAAIMADYKNDKIH